jgi:Asp-tRNA(Asn)/Glu-tRNA(Gln) amidotransferase A subunit family amidase
MQLAGKPFDEATLITVADAYQASTDWHLRTPTGLADEPHAPRASRALPETRRDTQALSRNRNEGAHITDVAVPSTMLALAGIAATPKDRDELFDLYAQIRPNVEALYAVPQARYQVPALTFSAQPKLKDWRT